MNRHPYSGLRPGFNAFGDVLADPGQLSRAERIDLLRRQAGRLLADGNREARWVGERLQTWLASGGELDAVLGVRAPRGSRATPQERVRRDEVDNLLLRLSVQVGGDAKALEMLRDNRLDLLISGETAFADLPLAYPAILADPATLCHRIRY